MRKTHSVHGSILFTYSYIVNLLTTNSMRLVLPTNALELITTMVVGFIFIFTTTGLIARFTTMLSITNYSKANYEYDIDELRIYLQVCNVFFFKSLQNTQIPLHGCDFFFLL